MYNIRYLKLNFSLTILEDSILPTFKNSTIRGSMGRMLMDFYCNEHGKCDKCKDSTKCVVKNIMYPEFQIKPKFVSDNSGVGYIIECFDKRERYNKGDILRFNLIVFGKTIDYIDHIIYAFDAIGYKGIGTNNTKYKIINIVDDYDTVVYKNGLLLEENISVHYLQDYIEKRKKQFNNLPQIFMNIVSPLRYKKGGHYKEVLEYTDLLTALNRRIQILNYFEGYELESSVNLGLNFITDSNLIWREQHRYSGKQQKKMKFGGVEGMINLYILEERLLDLIIAGELIHIGKNTSFGLGKYTLS